MDGNVDGNVEIDETDGLEVHVRDTYSCCGFFNVNLITI